MRGCRMKGSVLQGPIKDGFDLFDALRAAIPASSGAAQQLRQAGLHWRRHRLSGLRPGQRAAGERVILSRRLTPSSPWPRAPSSSITSPGRSTSPWPPYLPGAKVNLIETIGGIDPDDNSGRGSELRRVSRPGRPEEYQEAVSRPRCTSMDGDIFQVVLARRPRSAA